jgi:dolichol-phosphate mannosyltransferase
MPGRHRLPAVLPRVDGPTDTSVSVVVPARNEATRIGACLAGLRIQGVPLIETIIVDGASTDDTPAMVDQAAAEDSRIRRIAEPPRPRNAVGRPWAIAAGCAVARGEWIMVIDADTRPQAGMVGGAVTSARAYGLDAVSFAPRIIAPTPIARWLQASFLATLIYRFGPAGLSGGAPERAMANGQCLLMRRSVLESAGGYIAAAESFCDDIRIVRHLAASGASVGFLDGPRLLDVVMYPSGADTWRAWPRSLNMRDATSASWRWIDAVFLLLSLGLPIPLLITLAAFGTSAAPTAIRVMTAALVVVNSLLLVVRVLLGAATAHSFAARGAAYWLAPVADFAVVVRLIEAVVRRPREWRGVHQVRTASN